MDFLDGMLYDDNVMMSKYAYERTKIITPKYFLSICRNLGMSKMFFFYFLAILNASVVVWCIPTL